jgi:hypothetical protein
MRNLTLGLLFALTLVLASPATAGGPSVVVLPGLDLLDLVLDWFRISEAVETSVSQMGPALEPGGVAASEPPVNIGPAAEAGGIVADPSPSSQAPNPPVNIGPALEAGG